MAHMFESGFFNRGVPAWHNLGVVIDDPTVRVEEAIKLAGLDWVVREVPIMDASGTVWRYNAVTQYVQHSRGRTEDSRLRGAWWGPGAELRDRAFEIAAAMVA